MFDFKTPLRKTADAIARNFPAPVARYFLKSYGTQQSAQNRIRFNIQPFSYFSPIATVDEIDTARLTAKRKFPSIIPELSTFDSLIGQLAPFASELHSFTKLRREGDEFWFHNFAYEDFDAATLYSLLRLWKPKRMVEIGSGFSSRVTTMAARKNASEGAPMDCRFIEPYPPKHLLNYKLSGPLVVEKIQKEPLETFSKLESGDVVFVDTSHVLKTQNDLCYIFHAILPCLAKGVYIHFHDIFSPYDYPPEWLLKIAFYFNEQYALEAILCNSSNFEVVLPVYALSRDRIEKLRQLLPGGEKAPGAFWIRKKL